MGGYDDDACEVCEGCGKVIAPGDKAHHGSEVWLCEDCAPDYEDLHRQLEEAVSRIYDLQIRRDGLLDENSRFEQQARDARAEIKTILTAITDPENQPSQWGTVLDEKTFQARVDPWLLDCFGPEIARDGVERNHRFLEEALELVQAAGCTAAEAHQLVDYVFGRPVGDIGQEIGGVEVTLAALCLAHGYQKHVEAEIELARVWTLVEKIRAKHAAKPKIGPLPGGVTIWRHKVRGTTYTVVGEATMQDSYHGVRDHDTMVVYRSLEDGRLWVRAKSEFEDGRFVEVTREVEG